MQQKQIAAFRQGGKRGRRQEATSSSTNHLGLTWVDTTPPLTMAPCILAPVSTLPLQTPHVPLQPLQTLGHTQRDLVTLCSNLQTYIQAATYLGGPEELQSTGPGLFLSEATAVTLPAVTSASFFCWKAGLMPTSLESPTTMHPPPIAPKQKQIFSAGPGMEPGASLPTQRLKPLNSCK